MTNADTESLKFQMDQLRKDKLILATESIALLVFAITLQMFSELTNLDFQLIISITYITSFIFFVRMFIKNILRKKHIRLLETKVYGKEIKNLE